MFLLLIGMVELPGSFCHFATLLCHIPGSCSGISWANGELNLVCSSFAGSRFFLACLRREVSQIKLTNAVITFHFLVHIIQWFCFYVLFC